MPRAGQALSSFGSTRVAEGRFGRWLLGTVHRYGWRAVAAGGVAASCLYAALAVAFVQRLRGIEGVDTAGDWWDLALASALPLVVTTITLVLALALIDELARTRRWLLVEVERRLNAEASLRRLATTDELTGLDNRRQFFARARELVALARRYGQPVALMSIDVDRFKDVNDQHGHKAGDGVLLALARTLRSALRATDVFARIGGDEFVVLLPQSDTQAAMIAAERVRDTFRRQRSRFNLTLSVGVATACGETVQLEELLSRSDQALYKAKREGRNRVCLIDQFQPA